jgi:hypothetical protein
VSVKHPNKILAARMARAAVERQQAEQRAKEEAANAGRSYIKPKFKDWLEIQFQTEQGAGNRQGYAVHHAIAGGP